MSAVHPVNETTVRTGEILVHPAHGDMKVTNVGAEYEEFIGSEGRYVVGYEIQAVFDRFIPGVAWNVKNAQGDRISMLKFHSWYLRNLKRKG